MIEGIEFQRWPAAGHLERSAARPWPKKRSTDRGATVRNLGVFKYQPS